MKTWAVLILSMFLCITGIYAAPHLEYGAYPLKKSKLSVTSKPASTVWDAMAMLPPHPEELDINVDSGEPIRVYAIHNLKLYPEFSQQLDLLRSVLKNKHLKIPLNTNKASNSTYLPEFPMLNCGHAYQARVHFVETDQFTGEEYLTQFVQDDCELSEVTYVLQALTKDGKYYITAIIWLDNSKIPTYSKTEDKDRFNNAFMHFIDTCPDSYFTPTVSATDTWLKTLRIKD